MRRKLVITVLSLVLTGVSAHADSIRLKCIADTNVSSYPAEQNLNYGQSSRIRLKGIEMMGLFQFDTAPVSGWMVSSAKLYLRYANSDRKLRTIGISTISAPWTEGTGSAEAKPGETTFLNNGLLRWNGPDTDFTDVSFTAGNSRAVYGDITMLENGWFSVSVDPTIVQAMITGSSYGMAVTDEKGQTMANNDVYSKEQSGSEPYLVVQGEPIAFAPPAAPIAKLTPDPTHADFESGAVKITVTPADGTYSYNVRLRSTGDWSIIDRASIPFAVQVHQQVITLRGLPPSSPANVEIVPVGVSGAVGLPILVSGFASPAKVLPAALKRPADSTHHVPERTSAGINVWALPDTAKANPISGNNLEEVGNSRYSDAASGSSRNYNLVWDGGAVRLKGARNEVLGFQLVVETPAAADGLHAVVISHSKLFQSGRNTIQPNVSLYREWYVNASGWFPEACIPIKGPFEVPASDNRVSGQRNQSVFVEFPIPAAAAPGEYRGVFTLNAAGAKQITVPVILTVNSLTLPDTLNFDISLNTYGTLGSLFGIKDNTPEYRAIELDFQRMAHSHRSTLAALGYSHSGNISTNYAPPLVGAGGETRVTDWSKWDAQFGPYLDGSAFFDPYRKHVPISHLYLPFHEAWPVDIRKHYSYTQTVTDYPAMIAEHAMKAAPIEQAIDEEMQHGFTVIAKQFADHIREKGWTHTQFQFYQNDKHYYKDPKMGGRGTSWWLLDEPNHRDDWLALAFFNRLFQSGVGKPPIAPMVIREDISRPQWQRDYLDGLVNVMCVSGELFTKQPRLKQMREQLGVKYWNYGTANAVNRSNTEAEAWAVRAWICGADAIVPWQSIGEDKSFDTPEDTALLLPGTRFGIKGPIASLRLKALRRAQQDVEYLVLLAKKKGWDRDQIGAAIRGLLPLTTSIKKADEADAGSYQFGPLNAADFDAMRWAVGRLLLSSAN